MKKILVSLVIGVGIAVSPIIMAEGTIEKSTVIQNSNNKNAAAIAIGEKNKASVGSLNVSGDIKDSTVIQNTNNKNAAAIAIGKENKADIGSINVGK
jgi:hypothetical protein